MSNSGLLILSGLIATLGYLGLWKGIKKTEWKDKDAIRMVANITTISALGGFFCFLFIAFYMLGFGDPGFETVFSILVCALMSGIFYFVFICKVS